MKYTLIFISNNMRCIIPESIKKEYKDQFNLLNDVSDYILENTYIDTFNKKFTTENEEVYIIKDYNTDMILIDYIETVLKNIYIKEFLNFNNNFKVTFIYNFKQDKEKNHTTKKYHSIVLETLKKYDGLNKHSEIYVY